MQISTYVCVCVCMHAYLHIRLVFRLRVSLLRGKGKMDFIPKELQVRTRTDLGEVIKYLILQVSARGGAHFVGLFARAVYSYHKQLKERHLVLRLTSASRLCPDFCCHSNVDMHPLSLCMLVESGIELARVPCCVSWYEAAYRRPKLRLTE